MGSIGHLHHWSPLSVYFSISLEYSYCLLPSICFCYCHQCKLSWNQSIGPEADLRRFVYSPREIRLNAGASLCFNLINGHDGVYTQKKSLLSRLSVSQRLSPSWPILAPCSRK
ncbi:hypothetical protein BDV18DRAFT_28388 [Aspergillus unguis]